MNRSRLLVAITLGFLLTMALVYVAALRDSAPIPTPPAPLGEERLESAKLSTKTQPKSAPPPRRSGTPHFARSSRSSSNLDLAADGDSWAPNEHRIEGRVLAERSQPVPGVAVTYRTDGKRRTTKSDENGRFQITARGNKITLQAQRKDGLFTVRSETVEISGEGGEWEVDLVLETQRHGGLGVGIAKHSNGLRIRNVVKGGPASGLSLVKGDIILAAGGTTLAGLSTRQASKLLIGPEGTSQSIRIRHSGGDEADYTFIRQYLDK